MTRPEEDTPNIHPIDTVEIRLASAQPAHLVAVNILSTELADKPQSASWRNNNIAIKADLIAEILTNSQIPPEGRISIFNLLTDLRNQSYGFDEDNIYIFLDRLLTHFAPSKP